MTMCKPSGMPVARSHCRSISRGTERVETCLRARADHWRMVTSRLIAIRITEQFRCVDPIVTIDVPFAIRECYIWFLGSLVRLLLSGAVRNHR
jgi:hypothetical protein